VLGGKSAPHLGNTFECQPESTKTRAKSETVVRMNVQFFRRVFEAIVVLSEAIRITQIRVILEYFLVSVPQEP